MKIFYIVILGISIGILLKAAHYFLSLATHHKPLHTYILKWFPWVQVFIWAAYVFWVIDYLFMHTAIYNLLISAYLLLFMGFLGWYVFRDFVAGAVVRSGQSLEPGLRISTENWSGTIATIGYFNLEIITPEGERIKIPYHRLRDETIIRKSESGGGKNQTIKVTVPLQLGALNIEQGITRKLLELPWIVAGADIRIRMIAKEDFYDTEISYYSIREDMVARTEEIIRNHVDELKRESRKTVNESTKKPEK